MSEGLEEETGGEVESDGGQEESQNPAMSSLEEQTLKGERELVSV